MKKTSALLLACFMIFSLFIAGCSSSSSDDKEAKSGEKGNGGGVLIYGRGGDSTALDPAITTKVNHLMLQSTSLKLLLTMVKIIQKLNQVLQKAGKFLMIT